MVYNYWQAAEHIALCPHDGAFEWFLDDALEHNSAYSFLSSKVPPETPPALLDYQEKYPDYNPEEVDREINSFGVILAEGQCLFHGGLWPSHTIPFPTDRPLSTSFNPQKAWNNAVWQGKAYDAGRIDLIVLKVTSEKSKAYYYGPGGQHGHEKEVLFATGATLRFVSRTHVCDGTVYMSRDFLERTKVVPVYVIEAEIF